MYAGNPGEIDFGSSQRGFELSGVDCMSEYFNLSDFNSDLLETAMVKNFVGLVKQEFISY